MRTIRVLFDVYLLYHLPQFLPFYRLISNDPRFEIYFSPGGHSGGEKARILEVFAGEGLTNIVDGANEPERWRRIDDLRVDFVFVGWGRLGYILNITDRPRPKVVMIYHGIGVKASYYRDRNPRVDYRAVESPYRVEQLRKHNVRAVPLLTGCVKLDPLYRPAPEERKWLLAELGLDPSRKSILYAPTFYPSSIGVLGDCLGTSTAGHNLIIKPHNYTRYHPDYVDDLRVLKGVAERFGHAVLVPDRYYNLLPLMQASDLLLTDASSAMFEYLALDRPIIVFEKYRLLWRHRLVPWLFRRNRMDGETIGHRGFYDALRRPARLREAIEESLANPLRLSSNRKAMYRTMLHFDDGRAANRLLEYFEEMIAELEKEEAGGGHR